MPRCAASTAGRADPRARARRAGGVRAPRRALAPQPARGRRRAAAGCQRRSRPLDARRARGGRGPGRRLAGRADPRLALPRRRQRRPQHARPLADPRYRELRSRIGIDPATALPLGDNPGFGWHPSLAGLRELYDGGKVAVLPAVDYSIPISRTSTRAASGAAASSAGARSQRLARRTLDAIGRTTTRCRASTLAGVRTRR